MTGSWRAGAVATSSYSRCAIASSSVVSMTRSAFSMNTSSRIRWSQAARYAGATPPETSTAMRRSCMRSRCSTGVKSASPDMMMNSSKRVRCSSASMMSITITMSALFFERNVRGGQSMTEKPLRVK